MRPELKTNFGAGKPLNLLHEVFAHCLFYVQEEHLDLQDYTATTSTQITLASTANTEFERKYVKAKWSTSRAAAYRLLLTLCEGNVGNFEELVNDGLLRLMDKFPEVNSFNYFPASDAKSYYGYLGIKNLGCICYMLAML